MSVTTVLGEIDGRDLGVTLPHEHLLIDLRGLVRKPDPAENPAFYEKLNLENLYRIKADPYALEDNAIINEPSVAVQELIAYREAGGRSVVDVTPRSIGRDPLRLREISLRSGVHVVMGCGQYIAAAHEEKVSGCSVEDLAAEIIEEIRTGADGTDVRAGVIGEIGTSEVIAEEELKCLRAAGIAAAETGKSVHVHTALFEQNGHRVCDELMALGVAAEQIAVDHVDAKTNLEYVLSMLDRGVYVEFDNFGKEFQVSKDSRVLKASFDYDRVRADCLARLCEAGYTERILAANDICLKHMLRRYGGGGYGYLLTGIVPMMRDRGLTEKTIETILVKNPQRFLCGKEAIK